METFYNEGLFRKAVLKDRRGKQKIKRNNGNNDKIKKKLTNTLISTRYCYPILLLGAMRLEGLCFI